MALATVLDVVLMLLLGVNGGLNTVFSELDYVALQDAIDGSQLMSFLPAMDVKMPPNANLLLSILSQLTMMDPKEFMTESLGLESEEDSSTEVVFGEMPITEPLNDRIATIGFHDMNPVSRIGPVSIAFLSQVASLVIVLVCFFCHNKIGSMFA